jgi:hypothetical protein
LTCELDRLWDLPIDPCTTQVAHSHSKYYHTVHIILTENSRTNYDCVRKPIFYSQFMYLQKHINIFSQFIWYTKNKSFITQSLGSEEDSQPLNTKYALDNPQYAK